MNRASSVRERLETLASANWQSLNSQRCDWTILPAIMLVAILVGIIVLLFTTVIQAIASGATVQVATSMMRHGWAGARFWRNVGVMLAISLIALVGIILQISVWAFVVFELDKFQQFSGAFYYSASNFTTLG